jgi:beta-lactamase regulating signal transducer with metallopeptidase domain
VSALAAWDVASLLFALAELTLVLGAACAIDRLATPRLRPHLRHAFWTLVAVRMLLSLVPPGLLERPFSNPTLVVIDGGTLQASAASLPSVPGWWLLAAWSAGAALLAARWTCATLRARRRQRPLAFGRDDALEQDCRLNAIARRVGLRRVPAVYIDKATGSLYVTGLLQPRLVLPPDWQRWPAHMLDHALAHELRHIARRDLWAEALWMLLALIYWFHPLAHAARRRAHESREMCCDADLAARLGPAYRATLLRIVASTFGAMAAAAAAPGRHAWHPAIARLHALDRWPAPATRRHRLAAGLALAALALLLLPSHVAMARTEPAGVAVEALLDPVTRQELGMGSLHLRYAVMAAGSEPR